MTTFITVGLITLASLLAVAACLHLIPKLGAPGRAFSEWLCAAPGLDVLITYFTVAPLFVGPIVAGWIGLAASVVAQILTVMLWTFAHGLAHPAARKGPRIVNLLNSLVGTWRNFLAVWVTAIVVPMFWIIRMAEIFVYPFLVWLIRFPRYKQGEWVRVSRHKFKNLVGHDLIWCLYCDWMTGVWSLGSEMLRNVESFWCPIRFHSENKCDNCHHDFPDVFNGWVPADATMEDVTNILREKYGDAKVNSWYGHPARLTVEGQSTDDTSA